MGDLDPVRTILLLANIERLTESERQWLHDTWRRALHPSSKSIEVENTCERDWHRAADLKRATASRHINHDACLVAYTFARHKRADDLERLLDTGRPLQDPELRAELVFAFAMTGDPRFRSHVVAYAKDIWSRNAQSPSYRTALETVTRLRRGRLPRRVSSVNLDARYREDTLARYLFGIGGDPSIRAEIMLDRSLPPAVRLYAVEQGEARREPRQLRLAIETCEEIAGLPDSTVAMIAREHIRRLQGGSERSSSRDRRR